MMHATCEVLRAQTVENRGNAAWPRHPEQGDHTLRSAREGHAADILVHLDDDDYSHPNRIAEQVVLLQSSGADCVGYREMLFWQNRSG